MSKKEVSIPEGYTQLDEVEYRKGIYYIPVELSNESPRYTQDICPNCNADTLRRSGRTNFVVVDLPVDNIPVRLIIKRRRYQCKSCSYSCSESLESIFDQYKFTVRAMAYIQEQFLYGASFKDMGKYFSVSPLTIKQIFGDNLFSERNKIETPEFIGIYEIHLYNRWYQIIVNVEKNTIVAVIPASLKVLKEYLSKLKNKDRIRSCLVNKFYSQNLNDIMVVLIDGLPKAKMIINAFVLIRMEYHDLLSSIHLSTILAEMQKHERITPAIFPNHMEKNKNTIAFLRADFIAEDQRSLENTYETIKALDLKLKDIVIQYKNTYPDMEFIYDCHKLFFEASINNDKEVYKTWLGKVNNIPDYNENLKDIIQAIITYNVYTSYVRDIAIFMTIFQAKITDFQYSSAVSKLFHMLMQDEPRSLPFPPTRNAIFKGHMFVSEETERLTIIKVMYGDCIVRNNKQEQLKYGIDIACLNEVLLEQYDLDDWLD